MGTRDARGPGSTSRRARVGSFLGVGCTCCVPHLRHMSLDDPRLAVGVQAASRGFVALDRPHATTQRWPRRSRTRHDAESSTPTQALAYCTPSPPPQVEARAGYISDAIILGGAGGGGSREGEKDIWWTAGTARGETWTSHAQKHSEAGYGRPVDRGAWTAKTVKRPRQQPAHPQYANYYCDCWAPLTRKRHTMPHAAQPQHTNYWAP